MPNSTNVRTRSSASNRGYSGRVEGGGPATFRLVVLGVVVILGFTGTACDDGRSPTMPSQSPPPSPAPPPPPLPSTVTGVVYEHTSAGPRPLAGAPIDVSGEEVSSTYKAISDDNGRYVVTDLVPGQPLKAVAEKRGYRQPCRTPVAGAVIDLHVVSDSVLTTNGLPASVPMTEPFLSGRVYEQTSEGPRGIPGAIVVGDFSGGFGWAPSATTMTDPNGRYSLCNMQDIGLRFGFLLNVNKPGFVSASGAEFFDVRVDLGMSRTIDVELFRK